MYRKAMTSLVLMNLVFLFGVLCVKGAERSRLLSLAQPAYLFAMDETLMADEDCSSMGIAATAASGQRVVDCHVLEKEYEYELDQENLETLYRIVEAEAGSEDEDGKLLVANVVLNRMEDEQFPDTVKEVVFQKEKGICQFSPIKDGRYFQVVVSDETVEAVERALAGEDISQGALYFVARSHADDSRVNWFDNHLTYLFRHGGHEFYTTP